MLKWAALVLLLLLTTTAHAQDRIATTVFLGGAITDDLTTWRNMQAGHPESNPLYASMQDKPTGVALTLVITDVVTLWLAHRYTPTHPRLVKVILFTLGGIRITEGVTNGRVWYADTHQPIFIPNRH